MVRRCRARKSHAPTPPRRESVASLWKGKVLFVWREWELTVPTRGYRKPEPTLALMSLIGRTNPVGTPFLSASWESDRWVFAMQIGRLPKPWGEKRWQRKCIGSFYKRPIQLWRFPQTAADRKQAWLDRWKTQIEELRCWPAWCRAPPCVEPPGEAQYHLLRRSSVQLFGSCQQ